MRRVLLVAALAVAVLVAGCAKQEENAPKTDGSTAPGGKAGVPNAQSVDGMTPVQKAPPLEAGSAMKGN